MTRWDGNMRTIANHIRSIPNSSQCDWSEADDLDSTLITGGGAFNLSKLPMQKTAWGSCEVV
jgi:hypothetical protein